MTAKDINDIINVICQNDEDFEKACISPAYLKKELEALALEQEPCEDCVSRTEVISYIRTLACDLSYRSVTDEVVKDIEALPSVTPVQKWNLTPPTKNTYDILLSVKPENEEPHVWVGSYEDGHYYFADGILDVDNEIIGWAPLPKPYEGSETE